MFKELRNQISEKKGNFDKYLAFSDVLLSLILILIAKVEKLEKLKVERDADEGGLKDIKNIVSKLNGIASVWGCVRIAIS